MYKDSAPLHLPGVKSACVQYVITAAFSVISTQAGMYNNNLKSANQTEAPSVMDTLQVVQFIRLELESWTKIQKYILLTLPF